MEKSVFITGATVNTGLGIAEKFAKEGIISFSVAEMRKMQKKQQRNCQKNMVFMQRVMV